MANVRLGSLVVDISGSVGDETFARNQGGIYVRERVSPAQPASAERDARQAAITAISQAWSGTLTETQRSTWRTYSFRHPLPDRFGRPKTPSGICHFIKCNVQRYRDETAITATSAPALPPPAMPTFLCTAKAAGALEVTGNPVPDVTGSYLLDGTNDGYPVWKLDGQAYWIWFRSSNGYWYLNTTVGAVSAPYWYNLPPLIGAFTPGTGASGTPTPAYDNPQSSVTLELPAPIWTDPPASTRVFAFAGELVTLGRNYYATPWRYIGRNTYDGSDWDLEPWTVPHWQVLAVPGRTFLRLVHVEPDGATSVAGYARTNVSA